MKKKILFIPPSLVGDSILASSLLGWAIEKHPTAKITVVCTPYTHSLFTSVEGLERCVILKKRFLSLHWLWLWLHLAWKPWYMIINLRNTPITFLFLRFKHIFQFKVRADCHRVLNYGFLVREVSPPPPPKIFLKETDYAAAFRLLEPLSARQKPIVIFAPIAGSQAKSAPPSLWIDLAQRLLHPQNGLLADGSLAIVGHTDQQKGIESFLKDFPPAQTFDLTGALPLTTLAALFTKASLFIGNDSGLSHMAAAVNIPTLSLFSITLPFYYHPWGTKATYLEPVVPSQMVIPPLSIYPPGPFYKRLRNKGQPLNPPSTHVCIDYGSFFHALSTNQILARIETLLYDSTQRDQHD